MKFRYKIKPYVRYNRREYYINIEEYKYNKWLRRFVWSRCKEAWFIDMFCKMGYGKCPDTYEATLAVLEKEYGSMDAFITEYIKKVLKPMDFANPDLNALDNFVLSGGNQNEWHTIEIKGDE